jgi:FMN phosphatase YigB (HAD superfamily)
MHFTELGAVTIDGYGTLLELKDPISPLQAALERQGVDRAEDAVAEAFRAEVQHYRPRAHQGRDAASLASLRLECVEVFLAELDTPLEPAAFVDDFIGALVFEPVTGAIGALERLRDRELPLAVVANWDCALPEHLERAGLAPFFATVVTSARAGCPKPDPRIFELALSELGVLPARTLHVGDERADEEGARAAGLAFAPAPLAVAVERLG